MQLNDLKRALPTEIARVTAKITKLETELQQLEECRLDVAENLFMGLEPDNGMGEGLQTDKANVRDLNIWRRLNEFKSDIQPEKQNIEKEALRVESQIARLKDSKQWLTDMSIRINQIQVNNDGVLDRNRLVQEFKGYLRKKIGLEKLENAENNSGRRGGERDQAGAGSTFGRDTAEKDLAAELNRDRETIISKERNWLRDELGPMTRF